MNIVMKIGKILFYILSWVPLVWTLLILIASYNYHFTDDSYEYDIFINSLKYYFKLVLIFYVVYGGFFIWLILTMFLTSKKIITKRKCIINISLVTIGIALAYFAAKYDIFLVSDYYLD